MGTFLTLTLPMAFHFGLSPVFKKRLLGGLVLVLILAFCAWLIAWEVSLVQTFTEVLRQQGQFFPE